MDINSEIDKKTAEFEKMSPESKKEWIKLLGLNFSTDVINKAYGFAIPAIKTSISAGNIPLTIAFIAALPFQNTINRTFSFFKEKVESKFNVASKQDLFEKTVEIYDKIKEVATKEDEETNNISKMSHPELLQKTTAHIEVSRSKKTRFIENVFSSATTLISLGGAVVYGVQNAGNIPMFLGVTGTCLTATSVVSYLEVKRREKYYKKMSEARSLNEEAREDVLNVEPINEKHKNYILNKFMNKSIETDKITRDRRLKDGKAKLIDTIVKSAAIGGVLLSSTTGIENFNFETATSLIAMTILYNNIIGSIDNQISNVQEFFNIKKEAKTLEKQFKRNIGEYIQQKSRVLEFNDQVKKIEIKDYEYTHTDLNDRSREICTVRVPKFEVESGTTSIIAGNSGLGKSTFIKSLIGKTERDVESNCVTINDEFKTNKIPNTAYDDADSKMGHNSLLEELTLTSDKNQVDDKKIIDILSGLGISEILLKKSGNLGLINALENLNTNENYSSGEKRRILLARFLYNLDEKVDTVIFDEPTKGLDRDTMKEKEAETCAIRTFKYINDFCNRDKQRSVIIVTHDWPEAIKSGIADRTYEIDKESCIKEYEIDKLKETHKFKTNEFDEISNKGKEEVLSKDKSSNNNKEWSDYVI